VGVITPGRLGELMKAGYQKKREGVVASVIKVLVERGLDVGFFVAVAGGALIWAGLMSAPMYAGYLTFIGGLGIFLFSVLLISSNNLNRLIIRFYQKLKAVYTVQKPSSSFYIVVLSVLSNCAAFLSCYFLVLGIDLNIGLLAVSGGMAIAGLLNMLPITIMGLGTRELTFLYVFASFPAEQILALSGLLFLVAQVGGGILALIMGQIFLFSSKNKK